MEESWTIHHQEIRKLSAGGSSRSPMRNDVSFFFCEFCLTFATAGDDSREQRENKHSFSLGHFCTKCITTTTREAAAGQLQIHFQTRINTEEEVVVCVTALQNPPFLARSNFFQEQGKKSNCFKNPGFLPSSDAWQSGYHDDTWNRHIIMWHVMQQQQGVCRSQYCIYG